LFLTREEERILEGSEGSAKQRALEVVVKVGEALGAERLVRVSSAHVSGVSYKNVGRAGLELMEELAREGGKFSVYTSLNPAGMDVRLWRLMGLPEEYARGQLRVVKVLTSMGADPTLSCVPYLLRHVGRGEQLAWGESNAVLYANSVLGARTNREGGPLALFEAIAGRAPYVDLRTDEGRRPTVVVEFDVRGGAPCPLTPGLLGFHLGRAVGQGVPLVRGVAPLLPTDYDLRLFLAGVGTASGIGMVLIEGVSPEAERCSADGLEKLSIDGAELADSYDRISVGVNDPDAIALGCPHLSRAELEWFVERATSRGRAKTRILLFAPRRLADSSELVRLRKYNVEVYNDTCMVVCDLRAMGIERLVVDSAKAAYYLTAQGYEVELTSTEGALRRALA